MEKPLPLDGVKIIELTRVIVGPCTVPFDNPPFRFSKTSCEVRMSAPCLGEHNEYICRQILGVSGEEFVELIQSGALE